MNKRFVVLIVTIPFILFGSGLFGLNVYRKLTYARATGKVTGYESHSSTSEGRMQRMYAPKVDFTLPDGRRISFTSDISSNAKNYAVGGDISVLYDPNKPSNALIDSVFQLFLFPLIFLGMGSLLLAIFCGRAVLVRFRDNKQARLRAQGMRLASTTYRVEEDKTMGVGRGRSAPTQYGFKIYADAIDPKTGQARTFESQRLWFDPKPHLTEVKSLDIYLDANGKDYFVDVDFLPDDDRPPAALAT